LATLNEAHRIDRCLRSIRDQEYDQRAVDILVADGGSSDDTVARCESYGAKVYANPLVRCEPGIARLIERVGDGLVVVFAADNALLGRDWLTRVTAAFDAPDVVASFCRVASDRSQGSMSSRYLNRFTDPYNHFVYWSGADYPSLPSTYKSKLARRAGDTYFFRFGEDDCPLIALAQGVTFRAPHARDPGTDEDDIVPFTEVARSGLTAYVSDVRIGHAQVRDLGELLRKYGPRIREKLFPDSPHMLRVRRLNRVRRLRRLLWPLYAFALPLPVAIGIVMALKERETLWLYHPVISLAMACCLVRELVRVAPSLVRAWLSRPALKASR